MLRMLRAVAEEKMALSGFAGLIVPGFGQTALSGGWNHGKSGLGRDPRRSWI